MLGDLDAGLAPGDAHPRDRAQPIVRQRNARRWAFAVGCLGTFACGQVEGSRPAEPEAPGEVVAVESEPSLPSANDAPPRVTLSRRTLDGATSPLAGEYVSVVPFRDAQAAVTRQRELHLVRADGSRSVLAHELDGLPARADDGSLVYAARFSEWVEIYWLTVSGAQRRVASFGGSATRLSPRADGSVVFVGAETGGVSGIWVADSHGARCLTNCGLRVGHPFGSNYRVPPGDTATVRILKDAIEWQTPDGSWSSASRRDKP